MAQSRPVVVLAGPTHEDGRAQLEREVDVILCEEETEEAFLKVASGAHGILFRAKPRASDSLMAACPDLKVIGRHGVGLDTVDIPAATRRGIAVGYDPYLSEAELRQRGVEPQRSLEAMLPQVDILTTHTPLTPETRGMINDKTLGLLKKGAIYVNTSRGPVQQERAIFEALTRGHLAAAGLDVFEEEPSSADNPLFNLENVVCSSHVAGVTKEASRTASLQVTAEMLRVLRGDMPDVLVNPEVKARLGLK